MFYIFYYFNEFKIGNSKNYIEFIFNIEKPRIIKLLNYDKNFLFDKNEEILLTNYPKLKERKYCFEEFKINEKNNIECIYNMKDLEKKI